MFAVVRGTRIASRALAGWEARALSRVAVRGHATLAVVSDVVYGLSC